MFLEIINYCIKCGSEVTQRIPEGDTHTRYVCTKCEHIHYQNPKIIVGCVVYRGDEVMLCRRAIEPRYGLWNLPAGFMENSERTEVGAAREVMEEANAKVNMDGMTLHSVYTLVEAQQVYIHFLAELDQWKNNDFGPESIECAMFKEEDIPWKEMAFTSSTFALKKFFADRKNGVRQVHLGHYPQKD